MNEDAELISCYAADGSEAAFAELTRRHVDLVYSAALRLVNGDELRGWVEWYDKGAIKFHRHDEPNLLVPKSSILYMFKEEELRRTPRKRLSVGGGVAGQAGPRPLDLDAEDDGSHEGED